MKELSKLNGAWAPAEQDADQEMNRRGEKMFPENGTEDG
jgi:hypothetical protein